MAHSKHSGLSILVVLFVGYLVYEWFKSQPAAAASTPSVVVNPSVPTSAAAASSIPGTPVAGTPLLTVPTAPVGASMIHNVIAPDGSLNEFLTPDPVQGFVNPNTGAPAVNPIVTAYSGAFSQSQVEDETVQGLFPKSYAFGGSPLQDMSGGGGGGGSISRFNTFDFLGGPDFAVA